jgi:hypothetical protein
MGRPLSLGPGRTRRCAPAVDAPLEAASEKSTGSPTPRASRSREITCRSDAAGKIGDEGVVTGTARVRYGDARRGDLERSAGLAHRTLILRVGSHGATTLVLPASDRTPTAAGRTPVETGGNVRTTPRQR